ncbi:MAG: SGNH/GDSL hydrolase family protein [Lentisphaeria bacterium]|nr:SGNH/GDSL hydrolase family protein [Lentisphaeria bacterium]
MKYTVLAVFAVFTALAGADEYKLDLFYSQKPWKSATKSKTISYKFDGKEKCVRFFEPCLVKTQFTLPQAQFNKKFTGITFKVKGDGSDNYGNLTISGTQIFGLRTTFPTKNTQWVEYRVAFKDMAPFSDFSAVPESAVAGNKFYEIAIGDNRSIGPGNKKRQAYSYLIKDLHLTDKVFPATGKKINTAPLSSVLEKMKAGKAVSLLFLGDSITAGTGLQKSASECYAAQLTGMLQKKFNNKNITWRTGAVGGFHTYEVLSYLDRDLAAGTPDAIFVLIGYNSRTSGQNTGIYASHIELLIQRIAQKTGSQSAIVLLPTVPGVPRFTTQQDMAEVCRKLAKQYSLATIDLDKRIEALGPEQYKAKYLRDGIHPNAQGHKFFAQTLFELFK